MIPDATAPAEEAPGASRVPTIALVGNPNAGKTTLFNRLTGLRAKTSNFPGTTVESRSAHWHAPFGEARVVDLPGTYALESASPEERVAREVLSGERDGAPRPDLVVLVVEATNLPRNLFLTSQVRELELPAVVALSMVDLAQRQEVDVDAAALEAELGVPVVPVSARDGQGLDELVAAMGEALGRPAPVADSPCGSCQGCHHEARFDWAEEVDARVTRRRSADALQRTDRLDRVLTHPILGLAVLSVLMLATFAMVFWLADQPMGWIESAFELAADLVSGWLPPGMLQSFVVDGLVAGIAGVVVFLPQICILFFLLSLLEDSGYLARAAFVMDRWMRKVGLPGKAFLPMLSAHACAIPAIYSAKVIENRRERILTVFVLPFFTCAARLPVYAMVTALLFRGRPLAAALAIAGAYALGALVAAGTALALGRPLLKGRPQPLVLELPHYRRPSLRNALLEVRDRASLFLRKAGTVVLAIGVILWAAATFPALEPEEVDGAAGEEIRALLAEAGRAEANGDGEAAASLEAEAAGRLAPLALEHSLAGRLGHAIEPLFAPMGFDWKMDVAVVTSFAAREVLVSTLAVIYGVGEAEADSDELIETLRSQTHPDGRPVFDLPTSLALLVFFVLAMQCLPTLAVTRRVTGTWAWAIAQFSYMSAVAWVAAWGTYRIASAL